MKKVNINEINIQRTYYKRTADQYEKMNNEDETDEHYFALSCLAGLSNQEIVNYINKKIKKKLI